MAKNRKRTYGYRDIQICLDAALGAERDSLMAKARRSPAEAKRIAEIEQEMRESIITIRVVGVPRMEYGKLQKPHIDATGKLDVERFFSDFIYKTGFEIEDGELSPLSDWKRREWDELSEGLTDAEYTALANAVIVLNQTRTDTGFLSLGSDAMEPSSPTSEPLEPGE